jgi:hypothetical protein
MHRLLAIYKASYSTFGEYEQRAALQEWAAESWCMWRSFLWFFPAMRKTKESHSYWFLVMPYRVWAAKKTREKQPHSEGEK